MLYFLTNNNPILKVRNLISKLRSMSKNKLRYSLSASSETKIEIGKLHC